MFKEKYNSRTLSENIGNSKSILKCKSFLIEINFVFLVPLIQYLHKSATFI